MKDAGMAFCSKYGQKFNDTFDTHIPGHILTSSLLQLLNHFQLLYLVIGFTFVTCQAEAEDLAKEIQGILAGPGTVKVSRSPTAWFQNQTRVLLWVYLASFPGPTCSRKGLVSTVYACA